MPPPSMARWMMDTPCGKYGVDLVIRQEAKTLGVWKTHTSFSFKNNEISLMPSLDSPHGRVLTLQRQYTEHTGSFSEQLRYSDGGIIQTRTFWDNLTCVADIERQYSYSFCSVADAHGTPTKQRRNLVTGEAAASPFAQSDGSEQLQGQGSSTSVTFEGAHEAQGHTYFTLGVTRDGQQPGERTMVSKRYSEFVAFDSVLRAKRQIAISDDDDTLPRLADRFLGRRKHQPAVIHERQEELRLYLHQALRHPLVGARHSLCSNYRLPSMVMALITSGCG